MPKVEITHDPNDKHSYHVVGTSPGAPPIIRHDKLIINGRVLMDEDIGLISANLAPNKISRDALYATNLTIPQELENGLYPSSGTITYEKVYSYNLDNPDILTFDIEGINPVFVHTPVCVDLNISDNTVHNQKPNPADDAKALILGRTFTVDISNSGTHRNIKGYRTKDYTKYLKDREIRFGFDTYFGENRQTGTYLKAGEWYSLNSLGISNSVLELTFYTPCWVDEGLYDVEIRNIAYNDTLLSTEPRANLNHANTVATASKRVEVSGRVYDFAITDIDDVAWESFFRVAPGSAQSTGKVFNTGPYNMDGVLRGRNHFMPVIPGKHDVLGYKDRAVKLGYAIKFQIKTVGNYYDANDYVRIIPSFAFVDKDGKNRREVDLYYSTPNNPLVKIGGPKDNLTQAMKLDFKYRGIDLEVFKKTAESIYRLRGGIRDYTIEKWAAGFPTLSQGGVNAYTYTRVLLSEPIRNFIGPTGNIPQGISTDKTFASAQKWYGEYRLPADLLIVPKGTDLSKERNLTRNSPVFLKDGYVLVNFRDIAVINNDEFENPSLMYTGKTGDGWALEGYDTNQGGWQLITGDVLAYYANRRATDDFMGTGTH